MTSSSLRLAVDKLAIARDGRLATCAEVNKSIPAGEMPPNALFESADNCADVQLAISNGAIAAAWLLERAAI